MSVTNTLGARKIKMPLIHIHSPASTFADDDHEALADELTLVALESERLPMEPFDKSTT